MNPNSRIHGPIRASITCAASAGSMSSLALGSTTPPTASSAWTYYETIPGGAGASPQAPGESAIQTHMTNTLNTPAEALEMQYPLRVRRFELAQNTGGLGLHPGGHAIIRELEFLTDVTGTILSDRRTRRPWGLAGASSGTAGRNTLIKSNGEEIPLRGKDQFAARAGDRIQIITPGGGGWGAVPVPSR